MSISRDYARMANRKQKRTANIPRWFWVVVALLILSISSGLYYLYHTRDERPKPEMPAKKKVIKKSLSLKKVSGSNPEFDYYQLLPNQDPAVSKSEMERLKYFVRIAQVTTYAEADALKATLALSGIKTEIKESVKEPKRFFVFVGPFKSQRIAKNKAQELATQQITNKIVNSLEE